MSTVSGTGIRGLASAIRPCDFIALNRTGAALVVGTVYAIGPVGAVNSEPGEMGADTLFTPGDPEDDITAQVIGDLAVGVPGIHAVALTAGVDNGQVKMRLMGVVQALVAAGVERGQRIAHDGSGNLAALADTEDTPDAYALQDSANPALTWVIFDGLHGFPSART